MGEHRRSREGTPGQARGTPEVGVSPDHGVPAGHAAVCPPPFRDCTYRLSLGSGRHYRRSGVGYHFRWLDLLQLHHDRCDGLERLSVPNTPIRSASEGSGLDEGVHHSRSCLAETLVEAEDHGAPISDRTAERAYPPAQSPETYVQDPQWNDLPGSPRWNDPPDSP